MPFSKQFKNFFQKIESGFVKYDLFLLEISPGDITSLLSAMTNNNNNNCSNDIL